MRAGFRISNIGLEQLRKQRVEPKVIEKLAQHVGRTSSNEAQFLIFLSQEVGADVVAKHSGKFVKAFDDPFNIRTLNSMEMGETLVMEEDVLRYRRVPGGWLAEYVDGNKVTAAAFINSALDRG